MMFYHLLLGPCIMFAQPIFRLRSCWADGKTPASLWAVAIHETSATTHSGIADVYLGVSWMCSLLILWSTYIIYIYTYIYILYIYIYIDGWMVCLFVCHVSSI